MSWAGDGFGVGGWGDHESSAVARGAIYRQKKMEHLYTHASNGFRVRATAGQKQNITRCQMEMRVLSFLSSYN